MYYLHLDSFQSCQSRSKC